MWWVAHVRPFDAGNGRAARAFAYVVLREALRRAGT
eukprot:gene17904-22294_t